MKLIFLFLSALAFYFGSYSRDTLFQYSTMTFFGALLLIETLLSRSTKQTNGINDFPSVLAPPRLVCPCLALLLIAFSGVTPSLPLFLVLVAVSCFPPLHRLAQIIERRLAVDLNLCGLRVLNFDLDSVLLTSNTNRLKVLTICEGAVHLFSWTSQDNKFYANDREVRMSSHPCLRRLASREETEVKSASWSMPDSYLDDGSDEVEPLNSDVREKLLYQLQLWKDDCELSFIVTSRILIAVVATPISLGKNVYSAVEDIANAGIRVVVWSRKPRDSVAFFVRKLRLNNDMIMTGSEWSQMPADEKKTSGVLVFAEFADQEQLIWTEKSTGGIVGVVSNSGDDSLAMETADFALKGGGDCLVPLFERISTASTATRKMQTLTRWLYWIGVLELLAVIYGRVAGKGWLAVDRLLAFECLVTISASLSAQFG
jgi:hypothetical protein